MPDNKTRHLDTAISILSGANAAKRQRSFTIQVAVHHDPKKNEFLVQVGSRVVMEGSGDREAAKRAGEEQVERLKVLGKKATVIVY